jgi:hypothetical protein
VNERSQQRVQKTESCQADPDAIHGERSDEVLHDDATATPRDRKRFDQLRKIATDKHDVRALARDIRPGSHRHAYRCLHESRCIVDSVSHHRDLVLSASEPIDKLKLLLGEQFRGDFVNAKLFANLLSNCFGIASQKNGFEAHGFSNCLTPASDGKSFEDFGDQDEKGGMNVVRTKMKMTRSARMRSRGYVTRNAPITAAMAPLAPKLGTADEGPAATWASRDPLLARDNELGQLRWAPRRVR